MTTDEALEVISSGIDENAAKIRESLGRIQTNKGEHSFWCYQILKAVAIVLKSYEAMFKENEGLRESFDEFRDTMRKIA